MKIVLEKREPEQSGDIISLERLLTIVESYSKPYALRLADTVSLNQWIKYLDNIANQIIRAHLDGAAVPTTFDLPFEKEYLSALHEEEEKQKHKCPTIKGV